MLESSEQSLKIAKNLLLAAVVFSKLKITPRLEKKLITYFHPTKCMEIFIQVLHTRIVCQLERERERLPHKSFIDLNEKLEQLFDFQILICFIQNSFG